MQRRAMSGDAPTAGDRSESAAGYPERKRKESNTDETETRETVISPKPQSLILALGALCAMRIHAHAQHWAFKKPVRPEIPAVKQTGWVKNPIDAFILQGLEKRGLSPSPRADGLT